MNATLKPGDAAAKSYVPKAPRRIHSSTTMTAFRAERMMYRILLVWSLAAVAGCGAENPDTAIRELLDDAEVAAEARDTGFFRGLISERYADSRGYDRERLIGMIRGYFLTHESVEVVTRVESVTLSGLDAAVVVVFVGALGRRAGASLIGGLDGELYRVELELSYQGGDWQVIGASWERSLE